MSHCSIRCVTFRWLVCMLYISHLSKWSLLYIKNGMQYLRIRLGKWSVPCVCIWANGGSHILLSTVTLKTDPCLVLRRIKKYWIDIMWWNFRNGLSDCLSLQVYKWICYTLGGFQENFKLLTGAFLFLSGIVYYGLTKILLSRISL